MLLSYTLCILLFGTMRFGYPIIAFTITKDPILASTCYFIALLPSALSGFFTGRLYSAVGLRGLFVISIGLSTLFSLLSLVYLSLDYNPTWLIGLLYPLLFTEVIWIPAFQGLLKHNNQKHKTTVLIKRTSTLARASQACAPLVFGIILLSENYGLLITLFGLGILLFTHYLIPYSTSSKQDTHTQSNLTSGLHTLKKQPFLSFVITRFFATGIFMHGIHASLLLVLANTHQLSESEIGWFFGIASLGIAVGHFILQTKRYENISKWDRVVFTGLFSAMSLFTLSITNNMIMMCLLWSITLTLGIVNTTTFNTEKITKIDAPEVPNITAITTTIVTLSIIPGFLINAFLISHFHERTVLITSSTCMLMISAVFVVLGQRMKNNTTFK